MKKIIFWNLMILLVMSLPVMFACSNDDDETTSDVSYDSYYVKYEIENGKQVTYASKTTREITYLDTRGAVTITVNNTGWNGTFGPFKRGDKVYMTFSSYGKYSSNARLSVSKNKEAFAIKDEYRDATGGKLQYTINY